MVHRTLAATCTFLRVDRRCGKLVSDASNAKKLEFRMEFGDSRLLLVCWSSRDIHRWHSEKSQWLASFHAIKHLSFTGVSGKRCLSITADGCNVALPRNGKLCCATTFQLVVDQSKFPRGNSCEQ